MGVFATMKNGEVVPLDERYATIPEVFMAVAEARSQSLTGSAMPTVELDGRNGRKISYSDVESLSLDRTS